VKETDPQSSIVRSELVHRQRSALDLDQSLDNGGNGGDSSREFPQPFFSPESSPVCWIALSEPPVARIARIRRSVDRREAKISKPFPPPFRMAARSYVSATTTRPNHRGSPPSSSFVLLPPLPLDIPQLPRYTGGGPVFIPRAAFLTRQSVLTGNSDLD